MRISGSCSNQELKEFKERKHCRNTNPSRCNRRFARESMFWWRAMMNEERKKNLIDAKNKEREERYSKISIRGSESVLQDYNYDFDSN